MPEARSRNSTKCRRICFDAHRKQDRMGTYLDCHVCNCRIDAVRDYWEADHIKRWAEGGEDTPENLLPICCDCAEMKNPADSSDIAKGKRRAHRTFGVKRSNRSFSRWPR